MRTVSLLVAALMAYPEAGCRRSSSLGPDDPVTFDEHIAPLVYERCTPCHRPDDAAPFAFLSYEDVVEHAEQIVEVVEDRYMPPWLPASGGPRFVNDRSLSEEEIGLFRRWVAAGLPKGNHWFAPRPPDRAMGWTLGEPDIVLTMDAPYEVPAGGPDIFRTFVLKVPIDRTVFVEAVELRPENPALLHHANIFLDATGTARHLDEQDAEPGFPGMEIKEARPPEGQFLAWTPGKRRIGSAVSSWRLEPGTDIVIQAHIQPSGRREPVRPRLGLHLTDTPPKPNLEATGLYTRAIDIPPGAKNHRVEFDYTLVVDVESLTVFPHAHFLGKSVKVYATLPTGETEDLIHIDKWDFNWQDEYTHTQPIPLPKGTVVHVEFIYDNSADNPQNPHTPPIRVMAGEKSKDEMANFFWQVRTKNEADRRRLRYDIERVFSLREMRDLEAMVQKVDHAEFNLTLGGYYERFGRFADAVAAYRRAIAIDPQFAFGYNNLAVALIKTGSAAAALEVLQHAHGLIGCKNERTTGCVGSAELHNNLGTAYSALRQPHKALEHYALATKFWPEFADAQFNAANEHMRLRDLQSALGLYRSALKSKPAAPNIHTNLAIALSMGGQMPQAIVHFEAAERYRPTAGASFNLGRAYETTGQRAAAIDAYRRTLARDPNFHDARARLQVLRDGGPRPRGAHDRVRR